MRLLFKRFLISLPFFAVSVIMFKCGVPISFFAVFLLVPPGVLMAEPVSMLVSNPVRSVFNPQSVSREIPLNFSIPEARIMEGKFEDALDLLKEMIPRDPKRLEVYLRIMNLAANKMKQPEIAKDAFGEGLKNMKDLSNRKILADEYRRLMNRCKDTHADEQDE